MSKKITITIEEDGDGFAQGLSINPYPGRQRHYQDPCEFCSNNPKNNPYASGICNCALPALANPIWC